MNETATAIPQRLLVCPLDKSELRQAGETLICQKHHVFEIEDGVPLFADRPRREEHPGNMQPCAIDPSSDVDYFVNDWIVNTNGNLYWGIRGRLKEYPIPLWPAESANSKGKVVVDLGCGWGRWSIAAAGAGYFSVGVDIHVDAVKAATRVARQLKKECRFICAEIDQLPFCDDSIDFVFSYSVLQHVDHAVVYRVLAEIQRVLKPGGQILIQLPNAVGPVSVLRQLRRGYRKAKQDSFEMRYWTSKQIEHLLRSANFDQITVRPDGFLSQNPQMSDLYLLSIAGKAVVTSSQMLSKAAHMFPMLTKIADSLWVGSTKKSMSITPDQDHTRCL